MSVEQITKKLIKIPSWVGSDSSEKEIGQFIFDYLKEISWLKVQKQMINGKRFNVLALGSDSPEILITGHLDTVRPTSAWKIDPFKPLAKKGRIYGLGSSDMKGGLATILSALKKVKSNKKIMLLFYCDEEYDFLGM